MTAWAVARLEAGGIRVHTRSLRYNLFTRSARVEGLVVSTTADPQHPFLEAERVQLSLPQSVWSGHLGVASLDADRVRIVLLRRRDGSTNYPQGQDTGPSRPPESLPVGALTLADTSLTWQDDVLDMGAAVDALSWRSILRLEAPPGRSPSNARPCSAWAVTRRRSPRPRA